MRRPCRRERGRTGCSGTTTGRGWRAGSDRRRRGSPPCSFSPFAARPRSTRERRSGWPTCRSGPSKFRIPWERNAPALGLGRDPVRTPIPWRSAPHGGFTSGRPWLPLGEDHETLNVEAQARNPKSMLSLYRALLRLRRTEQALSVGSYAAVAATDALLVYERRYRDRRLLIALNMSGRSERLNFALPTGRILLSSDLRDLNRTTRDQRLQPNEGWIVELGASPRSESGVTPKGT